MSTIKRSLRATCMTGLVMYGVACTPFYAVAQVSADAPQVVNIFDTPDNPVAPIMQASANIPAQPAQPVAPAPAAAAPTPAPAPATNSATPEPAASPANDVPLPVGTPQGQVNERDPATPGNAPQPGLSSPPSANPFADETAATGQAPATAAAGETPAEEDPFAKYREQFELLDGGKNEAAEGVTDDQRVSQSIGGGTAGEKTPQELETEIRKEAFNAAVNGFLPLRPDEIRRFLEVYDEAKQASNTPIYPHPKSESRVEEVSLDPADAPPVINLATGHVTTVTFLDATGARWPIASMTWAGDFDLSTPEEGGSIFKIIPLSDFSYGNVSINLLNLSAPVILTLKAQREKVDVRFDVQIPQEGPFAKPALIGASRGPKTKAGSVTMTSFLDGTPPDGAVALKVTGADSRTRAYRMSEKIYLRTPLSLISPAWDSSSQSADGMNIYVLSDTPVLLLSDEGKVERVFLDDHEENSSL